MKLFIKKILKAFGSIRGFFIICILLSIAMIAGTLTTQWDPFRTWWFIGLLVALAVNTLACVSIRWRSIRLPSLISHAGVLFILAGSTLTLLSGVRGTMVLKEGLDQLAVLKADDGDTIKAWLPFKVRLDKFEIEYYEKAKHMIRVTHGKTGESESREVQLGETKSFLKDQVSITPKRFVPDFYVDMETKTIGQRSAQPNNPALLVSLKASPERDLWIFSRFPGIHQGNLSVSIDYYYKKSPVKQYKSTLTLMSDEGKALFSDTIWVNKPLRYGGYTFYQSSYDPKDPTISILSVARDPGVPVVYLGFAVLMLGLSLGFFSNGGRHA